MNNFTINPQDLKSSVSHDWSKIYELACKELGVQQEKRDLVINLYLVVCGLMVSLAFGEKQQEVLNSGILSLVAALVGVMFCKIVIRYRVYKEVHWITCSTLTKMPYLKEDKVTKDNVQAMFAMTMKLNAKPFTLKGDVLSWRLFVKKNLFSAETYSFYIINFISCSMLGLSLFLLLNTPRMKCTAWPIAIACVAGLILFIYLLWEYMRHLYDVYGGINPKRNEDRRKKDFNDAFKKAWFLHVYVPEDCLERSE